MVFGPVFNREAAITPRRPRLYVVRTVYVVSLFVLMCTAWLVLAGTQIIQNIGDMARFGSILFRILVPLQLALVLFLSGLQAASAVAQEKDKKTMILLLMTRMTNGELVLGKLMSSLIHIGVLLVASLPVFMFICLFGGTSFQQVGWTFAVTTASALAAASLGSTIALWREKTFQTLSVTAMLIVFWIGTWEAIGQIGGSLFGIPFSRIAGAFSPLSAVLNSANPMITTSWTLDVLPFIVITILISLALNALAIFKVRDWNPNREVMPGQKDSEEETSIWSAEKSLALEGSQEEAGGPQGTESEKMRDGHVDARVRTASQKSRRVWNNPVLWREMRTWAYGRKVIIVRIAYLALAAAVFLGLNYLTSAEGSFASRGTEVPVLARLLAPFFLVSLVIINALSVNSITNERDGLSLDILLVTDLSPKEFLFGKLFGVLYVTIEMVLIPILLSLFAWFRGGVTTEILFYILGALLTLDVFVCSLGIHCGTVYANSRRAILVSLGTVFFLFLGIVTCMIMMVSFSSSFEGQLTPFLAFIVGGGLGLYVALGYRNPSGAMALATGTLPLAMFFAITSLLIGRSLSVFLVIVLTYGFTTLAMLMPALGEYNIAMGRMKTAEDD